MGRQDPARRGLTNRGAARRPILAIVCRVQLEMVERGQGRPILWLHGEDGLDPAAPVLDLLAAHGSVHAPSHPWYGHSPDSDTIDTIDDLAYLYLDFLDHDETVKGMEMFTREVYPRLKELERAPASTLC